ncbi:MAG: hypothetical protein JKX71_00705 [Amylibacter sp.]|nr:hypothetical protein [Amylibacter sp.]
MKVKEMLEFYQKDWENRLATVLGSLERVQKPFLKNYWQTSGYPTQVIFNGIDETPFPFDDYIQLYEDARFASKYESTKYYEQLLSAMSPVRGVLRDHPCLSRVVGKNIGVEEFHTGILNGSSWTNFNHLIAGLMWRKWSRREKSFETTVSEFNAMLLLGMRMLDHPLEDGLDKGLDVVLFYGAKITEEVGLGEGYSLIPFFKLEDYIDRNALRDMAPRQVEERRLEQFFGVVHPFRWRPEFRSMNDYRDSKPRTVPPLFHRKTAEFAELLSVVLEVPITWVMTLEGCINLKSCQLLGKDHDFGNKRYGRFVGHLHSSFRTPVSSDLGSIEYARDIFARKRDSDYAEIAPLIHRLSKSMRKEGRFSSEDRVLDLAIVLERLFKPNPNRKVGTLTQLQNSLVECLDCDEDDKDKLRGEMKHLYEVRSAIVHGPNKEKNRTRLKELDKAWRAGFKFTREAVLKSAE